MTRVTCPDCGKNTIDIERHLIKKHQVEIVYQHQQNVPRVEIPKITVRQTNLTRVSR